MVAHLQFAVMADIHGNRWALEAVLADITRRNITYIVNLGDSLYGPLDPAETARRLMDLKLPTVSGNEDRIIVERLEHGSPSLRYVLQQLQSDHVQWLSSLPVSMIVFEDVCLFHGRPRHDDAYLLETVTESGIGLNSTAAITATLSAVDQPVVLCAHSHVPRTVYLPDGRLIVNPGSVGLAAYFDDKPFPHCMEAGSPHARYGVLTRHDGGWMVEHIAVPYDWQTVARIARQNGRPDWAEWLLTGRAEGPIFD